MSLLNDALRKRRKEWRGHKGINLLKNEAGFFRKVNLKVLLYPVFLLVLLGLGYVLWDGILFEGRHITPPGISSDKESLTLVKVSPQRKIETVKKQNLLSDLSTVETAKKARENKNKKVYHVNKKKKEYLNDGYRAKPGGDREKTKLKPRKSNSSKKRSCVYYKKKERKSPFYKKALSLQKQGKLVTAIRMYLEALKGQPEDRDILFNLASAYVQVGRFDEAYVILERLNKEYPDDIHILLNKAVAEIGLEKFQKALNDLQKVEYSGKLTFEVALHRGIIFSRIGKYKEAIRQYKKAEKLLPTNSKLLFNMAVLYDKTKCYRKALEYYTLYLKDIPNLATERYIRQVEGRIRSLQVYLDVQEGQSN